MARADVLALYSEYKTGKAGAHQLMALLSSRHRNSQDGNVGVTLAQAQDIMVAWGFTASARQGMLDLYNALVAGTIERADLDNAFMLADVGAPHHTTAAEFADRVRQP